MACLGLCQVASDQEKLLALQRNQLATNDQTGGFSRPETTET